MRHSTRVRRAQWPYFAIVAAVLTLVSLGTSAAEVDVATGASVTSRHRSTAAVALDVVGSTWHLGRMSLAMDIGLTHINGISGYGHDFSRATWVAAGGLRVPRLWKQLYFSFQLAAAAPETPALSSPQEFVSTLGWSGHGVVVMLRHISNASTRAPNLGETMLLVGMRLDGRR